MLNVHQCEGSAVDACDDATSEASRPCPPLSNGRGGSKRTLGEFSTARKVVEVCGEGGSCRAHAEEKVRSVQKRPQSMRDLPDSDDHGILREPRGSQGGCEGVR